MLAPRTGRRPPVFREPHVASWYAPSFSDALGDRLLLCDNTTGDALEMLRLRSHLTRQPEFEARLRAQALILRGFHSPSFAAVHSIERLEETGNALAIVSSHVAGVRLSEVLHRAGQRRRAIPIDAALFIVRQLVHAMSALHSHAVGLTHGALSPERVVLTESGMVIVVEHTLGAALAELHYDRQRFWSELRLGTLPGTLAATIDPRTDVLQIGLVALSTILGRSLMTDDFPQAIDALLFEADDALREGQQYSRESVFIWLERALQQSPSSFASAVEAEKALEDWSAPPDATSTGASTRRTDRSWSGEGYSNPLLRPAAGQPALFSAYVSPAGGLAQSAQRRVLTRIRRQVHAYRRIWIPISAAAVTLVSTLAVVGVPTAADGRSGLVIATVPGGATVRIDGQEIGVTPVRQTLEPGTYELEVVKDRDIRRFTVVLRPNQDLTQYIEMNRRGQGSRVSDQVQAAQPERLESPPPALPNTPLLTAATANAAAGLPGSLLVSSPVDVEVFQNGRLIGVGGSKEISVPAGRLVVDLVNREIDFRTTASLAIEPGQRHTLALALPKGVLHVNAQPWAEVWIDGQRMGETPVANIALSLGRHQVVFRHPELGSVSRDVLIKASGESRVSVDLRRSSSQ